MTTPRLLVGTLEAGENEYPQCVGALAAQEYDGVVHHRTLSGLGNREAHHALYSLFGEERQNYELFVKLDADMVLSSATKLREMVELFRHDPMLDHAIFLVHDWMSDSDLVGLHVFSNRVLWQRTNDRIFVDRDPERPGRRLTIRDLPSPVAQHSPNPSSLQAFRFGVHRATKIVQSGSFWLDTAQANAQWRLLTAIWRAWRCAGDRRRLLALSGAQWALETPAEWAHQDYMDRRVAGELERLQALDDVALAAQVSTRWRGVVGRSWMRHRNTALRSGASHVARACLRTIRLVRGRGG